MIFGTRILGVAAVAAVASFGLSGAAHADVCDTPSKLGDLGKFEGEVITIAGSMQGKDEENLLATASCFEQVQEILTVLFVFLTSTCEIFSYFSLFDTRYTNSNTL